MSKDKNSYLNTALVSTSQEVNEGKGKNIIPPPERESLWKAYLEKFKDPIIIVLLVVFLFSVIVALYEIFVVGKGFDLLLEPSGVLMALLLATGVGFIFEVKAGREFDILNKVKDSRPVKVFRRNSASERATLLNISKQDVVVGDIVRLESGDEIPADGYLVDAVQLRVDESNFTGETKTIPRTSHLANHGQLCRSSSACWGVTPALLGVEQVPWDRRIQGDEFKGLLLKRSYFFKTLT